MKTFDFGLDSSRVLLHLNSCPTCLSRLVAIVRGIAAPDRSTLARHLAICAGAELERLELLERQRNRRSP